MKLSAKLAEYQKTKHMTKTLGKLGIREQELIISALSFYQKFLQQSDMLCDVTKNAHVLEDSQDLGLQVQNLLMKLQVSAE